MSLGSVRRRLRNLSEKMIALSDEVDALEAEIACLERPSLPYHFSPDGAAWGLGTIRVARRPAEPMPASKYWKIYAEQIQALLDEEEEPEYWIRRVEGADPHIWNLKLSTAGVQIVQSEWVGGRIGRVPDPIFPEQFSFDADSADAFDEACFEAFFHAAFPEAE